MHFDRKDLTDETLIDIYRKLVLPRLVEEKMLLLLRQGKISKWFSGIGQEAIAVGCSYALQPDEWIMPLHRNLGVFTTRNMPLNKLFNQWQGNRDGYSKGRERSFHFGSKEYAICGMISHLGPQMAIADGVALAHQLKQENKVSLAFTGEGGTSEGDFHEALNLAAVWNLPVIFIIENNGYALSTPVHEQYRCERLADKARGYGMDGVTIDGNNILTVIDTIKGIRDYCIREQKPYLVECLTFRMRGHEEASGTKYVPHELFEEWSQKDPILRFENYLKEQQIISAEGLNEIKEILKHEIEDELKSADHPAAFIPSFKDELADIYAPASQESNINLSVDNSTPGYIYSGEAKEKRLIDAIKEALHQSLSKDENLLLMGQDIADYGGAFKITEGFVQQFGKHRIRNTPICESAVLGAALGLSLEGYKSVVELQFADFITMGFNQVVNNLAKIYYRWGQSANVVIRMPAGAGVGAGPFHSQSNEAWFTHVPGLKVVYPATAMDAKGLLIAAIHDPNPVMFFEHKALYRSVSGPVPEEYYSIEIGKAKQVMEGEDICIITYGSGVHWALEFAAQHKETRFDIIDLRTLLPLDTTAITASVKRTGKVLILHEDTLTGGIGGEISAWISEHCFEWLDAPVIRCASLDTPVPFNTTLEQQFLAKSRLAECVHKLLAY